MTALLGSSLALTISNIPFDGPVAGVVVGKIGKEYIINPTVEQQEESEIHLTVAGTKDAIMMVEAGANEISDDEMVGAILFGHEEIKKLCAFQEEIVKEIGKPKKEMELYHIPEDLDAAVKAYGYDKLYAALDTFDRQERQDRQAAAEAEIIEHFAEIYPDQIREVKDSIYYIVKGIVRAKIFDGVRPDGRKLTEVRPIWCERSVLPRVHGSAVFTRGQTQVLSIATLSTLSDSQKIDTIWPEEEKRFMHHYNMPSYSTGEARASRSTSRREYGHGALVEKALEAVIPEVEDFPYAIRVVSEVLSSNGSTSQGSICGSTLALMDAGVPIRRPVAGISCGLISDQETGEWRTFTDIQGVEDFHGEMDFKVAGTTEGITAIQMDLKNKGLTMEIIADALERCRVARLQILNEVMLPCIAEPRAEVSEYAPKMISMKIPVDKIREVIGSGGKTIQKICADTGAKVDIEDDGSVFISAVDSAAAYAAKKMVDDICFVPEVGKLYYGKVVRILPIGAFVEIAPGHDGMVHISKLENRRVEKVEDVLNLGDMTWVKFMGFDEKGRANFSRKDALKEMAEQ